MTKTPPQKKKCPVSSLKGPSDARIQAQRQIHMRNVKRLNGEEINKRPTRSYRLFQPVRKTEPAITDDDDTGNDSNATILLENWEPPSEPSNGKENVIKYNEKTKTFGLPKRSVDKKTMKGHYYRCPVCKKKFPKLSAMNAHYRDVHPPLYCKTCEKEFVTPNGLE